jgi:type VII secretion integral membrane protein EccD
VSVHAGTAVVDLSLPAGVPVASLIPPIVDILEGRDTDSATPLAGRRYHLSLPGAPTLDASTTLAQNGIRDGAVMVLSQARTPLPVNRYDDVADAVSATLDATTGRSKQHGSRQATRLRGAVVASCLTGIGAVTLVRNAFSVNATRYSTAGVAALAGFIALVFAAFSHRVHGEAIAGLTLSAIATVLAAVAGFMAVPGTPGAPSVLLAAMAAAATSVLAMRFSGCGGVTLTAVSCFAMIVALAALAGVATAAQPHIIGSVSALVSLGLLGIATRASIMLTGLSPRLSPTPDLDAADRLAAKTIRADNWLTSLLAAFSGSASVGAIITVLTGASRLSCIAFATLTGALLLLYARCIDSRRTLIFVVSGILTTGTTFAVGAVSTPDHGPWIAAMTATLAAAAIYLGCVAPAIWLSPVVRRSVELMEYLALIAMVPLTCWICGLYGTVRGLNPKWS